MHAAATTAGAGEMPNAAGSPAPLPTLAQMERSEIECRLKLFSGNKSAVARSCGISLKTLYNRLAGYRAADTGIVR